jgi:hypothetical protein
MRVLSEAGLEMRGAELLEAAPTPTTVGASHAEEQTPRQ